MSKLPESLRRILDAQKPKQQQPIEPTGTVTTIWADGEIYKQAPGKPAIQLQSIPPTLSNT